jgi:uncharacterized oxidoreductase
MLNKKSAADSVRALGLQGALVTGASSGIGYATALMLASARIPVIALARDEQRLRQLAGTNSLIMPLVADLADIAALSLLMPRIVDLCPSLNCVIHNAAVQHNVRFDDQSVTPESIAQEVAVNLHAPMLLTHLLLPQLQLQNTAIIVTLDSVLSQMPKPTAAVYSATKAALRMFTESLVAQNLYPNVRLINVTMPLVDTPMTEGRGQGKITAHDAAAALLKGIGRNTSQHYVGKARAARLLMRFAPWLLARILRSEQ